MEYYEQFTGKTNIVTISLGTSNTTPASFRTSQTSTFVKNKLQIFYNDAEEAGSKQT